MLGITLDVKKNMIIEVSRWNNLYSSLLYSLCGLISLILKYLKKRTHQKGLLCLLFIQFFCLWLGDNQSYVSWTEKSWRFFWKVGRFGFEFILRLMVYCIRSSWCLNWRHMCPASITKRAKTWKLTTPWQTQNRVGTVSVTTEA